MKNACKALANLVLVLGAIGSGLLAKTFGQRLDFATLEMVRDSTRTATIFVSALFGVVIIWALLYAASKILENQECIMETLRRLEPAETSKNQKIKPLCDISVGLASVSDNTTKKSLEQLSNSPATPVTNKKDEWGEYHTWKCPNCKRINDESIGVCVCGTGRPVPTHENDSDDNIEVIDD